MKSYSMCLLFILVMTWGRKWWLGTRVQPNWTLSTPASTNRTLRDAALFTSSWLPRVFGELVILRHREKGSLQKLEAHPLGWFFKISQASGSRIPRLLACRALAVSAGSERMASH